MQIPQTDFYLLAPGGQLSVATTRDLFLGKRTVLFTVHGAFKNEDTAMLLEYEAAAPEIKAQGIDEVICLTVNDDYVAQAWAQANGLKEVAVLADGNGSFTTGLQAVAQKDNMGMGGRAWRLAMVVNANGMVEWAGIEEGQRANATDNLYEESRPDKVITGLLGLKEQALKAAQADENIQHAFNSIGEPVPAGFGND